jgi:hypothetical protein
MWCYDMSWHLIAVMCFVAFFICYPWYKCMFISMYHICI